MSVDDTPAHKALREAIVNTIVNSDFFLPSTITIDRYPDKPVFANPGTMLVSVEQYFEGGTSVCRNFTIQKIFGFTGGGERAGSGNQASTSPKTNLKKGQKTREEIIRIIKTDPMVSASETAISCKLTKAGIKYHLA